MNRVLGSALALALVVAACGTDTGATNTSEPDGPDPAAACLVGDPDCDDLGQPTIDEPLFVDDEPVSPPPDDAAPLIGGAMSVEEALSADIDGGFAIAGFYYDDGSGLRLCDLLAESFPPQCGGAEIPIDNSAGVELDGLTSAQGVTWTDQPAVLVGEIIDGVFVVTPMNS